MADSDPNTRPNPRIVRELVACDSHAEADAYTKAYYQSLTPQARLDLALELMSGYRETYPRFERIYRTTELGACPVSSDW